MRRSLEKKETTEVHVVLHVHSCLQFVLHAHNCILSCMSTVVLHVHSCLFDGFCIGFPFGLPTVFVAASLPQVLAAVSPLLMRFAVSLPQVLAAVSPPLMRLAVPYRKRQQRSPHRECALRSPYREC